MAKFCPECGRENVEKSRFCMSCGGRMPAEADAGLLDNRYEIVSTIKSSGMGFMYKARDIRLDAIVGIKQIISGYAEEDVEEMFAEQRFWEEARLLSRLEHQGIPKVMNFFTGYDAPSGRTAAYLVMSYIEGKNLKTLIEEKGKNQFSHDEILDYLRQALSILHYLHSRTPPFVYRVLKPSHLMIGEKKVHFTDFGIAGIFAPDRAKALTVIPGYAAPEQHEGEFTPRSDLYALGAVVHYLLTGLDPEMSTGSPRVFERPGSINPDIPPVLDEMVMAMLESDREKRPPSAAFILEKLGMPSQEKAPLTIDEKVPDIEEEEAPVPSPPPPERQNALPPVDEPPPPADLFVAVKRLDITGIKRYLAAGGDVNAMSHSGLAAIHMAAEKGYNDIIELLLKKGAGVNSAAKTGWTALHIAAMTGDVNLAKLLLSHGADIDARNEEGKTPLHRAIHWRHEDMIKLLLSEGANVNIADNEGITPLISAIALDREELTKFLIFKGADINFKDNNGSTPLHHAAFNDNLGSMKILLLRGAEVNMRNKDGLTPLHIVAQKKYGLVADLLVDLGADVNARDNSGQTPLHYAAQADFSMVTFLASRGADVNAKDNKRFTPLWRAEKARLRENIAVLRKFGAT